MKQRKNSAVSRKENSGNMWKNIMKITMLIALLIGVWSLAARCNNDAVVKDPTDATENNLNNGEESESSTSSRSADSDANVKESIDAVKTPESAGKPADSAGGEADFDLNNPENAKIAREVNEIMSHDREVFRQEMHDYGAKAVPYLLYLFEMQKKSRGDLELTALCLGAIGDNRAAKPIINQIEEIRNDEGYASGFVQALGYLSAQGSDCAYEFLIGIVQPENWGNNFSKGYLQSAFTALAKSNRDDALIALRQVFDPLRKKSVSQQPLTDIERQMLKSMNEVQVLHRQVRLTGIFGYYNSEIRREKGIVDDPEVVQ